MLVGDVARPQSDTPPAPRITVAISQVLVHLRERADDEGVVVATVADIAAALGVTDRTVQRARRALAAHGLLVVVPQVGGANRYSMTQPGEPVERRERGAL